MVYQIIRTLTAEINQAYDELRYNKQQLTVEVTFHIARHTFATTITLENGISIESVAHMLGHTSIRTTQIYAKVRKKKVANEMLALQAKLHP